MGREVKAPLAETGAAAEKPAAALLHEEDDETAERSRSACGRRVSDLAARAFREHRLVLAIMLCYIVAGLLLSSRVVDAAAQVYMVSIYNNVYFPLLLCFILFFLAGHAIDIIIHSSPDRLFPHLWSSLRSEYVTAERLTHSLPLLVATPFFFAVFTTLKSLIPELHPFSWDAKLAEWDVLLHGGRHPWQWLQPLLGNRWTTFGINILYNSWLLVSYAILFWQMFSLENREVRRRFLLSFMSAWIVIGTVGALFFSSAGPCFFEHVSDAPNPYEPLMSYLSGVDRTLPLWAVSAQEYLWNAYAGGQLAFAAGISAMPSMHVAAVALYALLGWHYNRLLGWCLTIYAAVIMIGSVHLGWHYAVDGYLGIIAAAALWFLFGWYGKRHPLPDCPADK